MTASDIYVKDLPEFMAAALRLKRDWFPNEPNWGPWFRGHARADWKLIPQIYRGGRTRRHLRGIEDEIRQEFAIRAPGLSGLSAEQPQNLWDWYFMMQHAGTPTRLLDWTEGALIALYFAVRGRENEDKEDASVWALEPWKLNGSVLKTEEVIAPGIATAFPESMVARYHPWLPELYTGTAELPPQPVAVYPSHSARRMSSQRSCFTIHGARVEGLEEFRSEYPQYLVNIIIAGSALPAIAEQLTLFGIDELTIFPDVDGLGRWLSTARRAEVRRS